MRYDFRNEEANVLSISIFTAGTSIEKGYLDVNNNVFNIVNQDRRSSKSNRSGFFMIYNIQGILQHNVLHRELDPTTNQYSVRHQIHVNEGEESLLSKICSTT